MKHFTLRKYLINSCLSFIALITLGEVVHAQEGFNSSLEKLAKTAIDELEVIPGISIAVVKNDSVVFLESFGYADVENEIKMNVNTPFYIASSTKSFVGLLAQILESEGVLNLDEPIINFKPIKDFTDTSEFKDITIRNLLTHTSGISNGYLVMRNAHTGEYTHEKLVQVLEDYTSLLNNNKAFKYDNLGYNIFDLILKEEFGLNWKLLLNQKLFSPLKMNRTTAFSSKIDSSNWLKAKPYMGIGDKNNPILFEVNKNDKMMQAAGGLFTSIKDASNWLLFNINKGKFNGSTLYSDDILLKAHKLYAEVDIKGKYFNLSGYSLGWFNSSYNGQKVLHHGGRFPGYSTRIAFAPRERIGVAVFVNESSFGGKLADLLVDYIYHHFLSQGNKEKFYNQEIIELRSKIIKMNDEYQESLLARKSNKQSLSLNIFKYEGSYVHDGLGTIIIKIEDNRLIFKMGPSIAYPTYTEMRDELEFERAGPGSKSEIIKFSVSNDSVLSLKYKKLDFMKKE